MQRSAAHIFISFSILLSGCATGSAPAAGGSNKDGPGEKVLVIRNVTLVPMTAGDSLVPTVTVVIRNDRIESINGAIPAKAQTIDGSGKFLVPGLADMHVHLPTDTRFAPKVPTGGATVFFNTQDVMTPYIVNGVTTVFELNGRPEHFGQRNEIAEGSVVGPRIALAALIDGDNKAGRAVNTPADGRQAVRSAKAEGYEFIKLYSGLNAETYKAIVDEAAKQGLKTVGHIPNAFKGKLEEAFVPHFGMVAHAEEFSKHTADFSGADAQRFAQLSKSNGTWLAPTLTTMEHILSQSRSLDELRASPTIGYVHPLIQSKWLTANSYNRNSSPDRVAYFQKMVNFHVLLVRAFKAAGVPVVAGTDAGVSGVVGGFSLHDELELLVKAGFTPLEALTSATRLPAEWLGTDSLTGTIAAGKHADLVLLDANPLLNISNTRKISGVVINGRWLSRHDLDAMLADLLKRNSAQKENFDWKKTIGR